MAQSGLDQVDRRAALERVRGVGVAQPMRGVLRLQACARGRVPDDALDRRPMQVTALA